MFRKNLQLKATKIIGQRKAFYRQRIPEPSCARKESVDIDILVTSRNGERKIMQSIRIMSRPHSSISETNSASSDEHLPKYHILTEKVNPCILNPSILILHGRKVFLGALFAGRFLINIWYCISCLLNINSVLIT